MTDKQKQAIEEAKRRNADMIAAMKEIIPIVQANDGKVYDKRVRDALRIGNGNVSCYAGKDPYCNHCYIEVLRGYRDSTSILVYRTEEEGKKARLDAERTIQEIESHIQALEAETESFDECAARWDFTLAQLKEAAEVMRTWKEGYSYRFIEAVGIPYDIVSAFKYNHIVDCRTY